MDSTNNKGQILIEICLVMFFFAVIAFAALNELSSKNKTYNKYQFSQGGFHDKKNPSQYKK